MDSLRIAIIGAGVSGLSFAQKLPAWVKIKVFEKARGVGGRMSTHYHDAFQFDQGAPFFTARSKLFKDVIRSEQLSPVIDEWAPKLMTLDPLGRHYKRQWFEPHYVASTKMNAFCKRLANGKNIYLQTRITSISKENGYWVLFDEGGSHYGPFDWVISSAPAPQTADLFPQEFSGYEDLHSIKMTSCFVLMVGLNIPWSHNWGGAIVKNSPLASIYIDSLKPQRNRQYKTSIVVRSTSDWASDRMSVPEASNIQAMLDPLVAILSIPKISVEYTKLHHWRYASPLCEETEDGLSYLIDPELKLAAVGDWCQNGTVEGAFLSGYYLSDYFKNNIFI